MKKSLKALTILTLVSVLLISGCGKTDASTYEKIKKDKHLQRKEHMRLIHSMMTAALS